MGVLAGPPSRADPTTLEGVGESILPLLSFGVLRHLLSRMLHLSLAG